MNDILITFGLCVCSFAVGWFLSKALTISKLSDAYEDGFEAGCNAMPELISEVQRIKPEPRPSCKPTVKLADFAASTPIRAGQKVTRGDTSHPIHGATITKIVK